jgi:hypothetical protein
MIHFDDESRCRPRLSISIGRSILLAHSSNIRRRLVTIFKDEKIHLLDVSSALPE